MELKFDVSKIIFENITNIQFWVEFFFINVNNENRNRNVKHKLISALQYSVNYMELGLVLS